MTAFYYTKRYDIASLYAGSGGVILVHRWTPPLPQEGFTLWELRNAEWDEFVRWNMGVSNPCLEGNLRRAEVEADFIVGSVAEDAWDGFCGRELRETGVWLMAAGTHRARAFMMEQLEAVIVLDLKPHEIQA